MLCALQFAAQAWRVGADAFVAQSAQRLKYRAVGTVKEVVRLEVKTVQSGRIDDERAKNVFLSVHIGNRFVGLACSLCHGGFRLSNATAPTGGAFLR